MTGFNLTLKIEGWVESWTLLWSSRAWAWNFGLVQCFFPTQLVYTIHKSTRMNIWDSTSVGEGNKTLFIRVWKPLPSTCILKTLRGSPKEIAQRGLYLLALGLDHYKLYQTQTSDCVSVRMLDPKRGGLRDSTSVEERRGHYLLMSGRYITYVSIKDRENYKRKKK